MCYAIGTMLTIGGTFFLWGPMSQLKKAFDKDRRIASIILIISIVMVLISALAIQSNALTFFMVLIQFAAFWWYSIVMLPFGRQIACACMKNCCK